MTPALFVALNNWVDQHYRDRLQFKDLADPQLLQEGRQALDELTKILNLGSIYSFQHL
ncbi:succinylarginine dihydrolase [Yersinia enterocolitica]|nr:succinylarginine dihydrolase [Yersinia enterocolitica]